MSALRTGVWSKHNWRVSVRTSTLSSAVIRKMLCCQRGFVSDGRPEECMNQNYIQLCWGLGIGMSRIDTGMLKVWGIKEPQVQMVILFCLYIMIIQRHQWLVNHHFYPRCLTSYQVSASWNNYILLATVDTLLLATTAWVFFMNIVQLICHTDKNLEKLLSKGRCFANFN